MGALRHKRKRAEVIILYMSGDSDWSHFVLCQVKAASVNGHFVPDCSIQHDHLHDLLEAMRLHHSVINEVHQGFMLIYVSS